MTGSSIEELSPTKCSLFLPSPGTSHYIDPFTWVFYFCALQSVHRPQEHDSLSLGWIYSTQGDVVGKQSWYFFLVVIMHLWFKHEYVFSVRCKCNISCV